MNHQNSTGPGKQTPSRQDPNEPVPVSAPPREGDQDQALRTTTPEVELPTHRPQVDEPDAIQASRRQAGQHSRGLQQQQQPIDSIQDTPRHSTRGGEENDQDRGKQANQQQHGDLHRGGEGNGNQQRGGVHGGLQGNLSQNGQPVTGQPQVGQRQKEGIQDGRQGPPREQGDQTELGLQGGLGKEETGRNFNETMTRDAERPGTNTRHR